MIGMRNVRTVLVSFPTYNDRSAEAATDFITIPKSVPKEHVMANAKNTVMIESLVVFAKASLVWILRA